MAARRALELVLLGAVLGGCHLLIGHDPPRIEARVPGDVTHDPRPAIDGPGADQPPLDLHPVDGPGPPELPLPSCADGTPEGACSKTPPLRCNSSLKLEHDCVSCTCAGFEQCNASTKGCEHPTVTLQSTEDSYLAEPTPESNFGTATELAVGHAWNGAFAALVRFDLTTIPTGATIESATLELRVVGWAGAGMVVPATITGVSAAWSELTTVWKNGPPAQASPAILQTLDFGANVIKASVLVSGWPRPAELGIRISPSTSDKRTVKLASREHATVSFRPKLTITYR